MPEKYVRREGVPILVRHTGPTTLPQDPPPKPPSGAGPGIVCLHDAGLQSSVFKAVLTEAAPEGGAIAFDLPGHGRSGSLDALPSIEEMTLWAKWVAQECGFERPILLGHGMGALIAYEWARSAGDSVAGILSCGAGLALGVSDEAVDIMRQVTLGKAPRPFDPSRVCPSGGQKMMRRAYMEGLGTDPRATLVDLMACRDYSAQMAPRTMEGTPERPEPSASAIRCRVALIAGASEDSTCRDRAETLFSPSDAAAGTTITIDDAAHFLPLEQPAALATEIKRMALAVSGAN